LKAAEDATATPNWVVSDGKALSGKVMRLPERSEIDAKLNEQLIVEYYSR
jgi:small subunit ribosomal protein S4